MFLLLMSVLFNARYFAQFDVWPTCRTLAVKNLNYNIDVLKFVSYALTDERVWPYMYTGKL